MDKVNYIKIRKLSLFSVTYMFLDIEDYLLDSLLIKREVYAKFGKEYAKDNSVFRIIAVTVSKKDEDRLLEAFEEMYNKALINGVKDYEDKCTEIFSKF